MAFVLFAVALAGLLSTCVCEPPISRFPGWTGPLAVPKVLPDGTLAETEEVAAARAFHLAALEAALASDPDMGKDDGEYDPRKYGDDAHGVLSYQDLAKGGVALEGLQSLSEVMGDTSTKGAPAAVRRGLVPVYPLAMLQLLASGYLGDTPEVAAARKNHLKALQETKAAAGPWRAKHAAPGVSKPANAVRFRQ